MSALVEALGRKAARQLTDLVGGRQLRIPGMASDAASARARQRLVDLVGLDLATNLITMFARTTVYVPRGPSLHNSRTSALPIRRIRELRRKGLTVPEIADKLGCSARGVNVRLAAFATALNGKETSTVLARKFGYSASYIRNLRVPIRSADRSG